MKVRIQYRGGVYCRTFCFHHDYTPKEVDDLNYCFEYECKTCDRDLNFLYVNIILKLKEAGLLDKNYPLICCLCWEEKREEEEEEDKW